MLNWLRNLISLRKDIPAAEPAVMAPPPEAVAPAPKKKTTKKPAAKKAAAPGKARKPKQ